MRLLAILVAADFPIAFIVSGLFHESFMHVLANILVVEGGLTLMVYAVIASRRLLLRYHQENRSDREAYVEHPGRNNAGEWALHVLLAALTLILAGFSLNLIIYLIE